MQEFIFDTPSLIRYITTNCRREEKKKGNGLCLYCAVLCILTSQRALCLHSTIHIHIIQEDEDEAMWGFCVLLKDTSTRRMQSLEIGPSTFKLLEECSGYYILYLQYI